MTKIIKKHKLLFGFLLLAIAAGIVIYLHSWQGYTITRQHNPKPTIKQLPVQNTPNNKQVGGSSSTNLGTSVDNSGNSPSAITTSPSQWAQSQSGLLTLQTPIANSTIATGFVINGLSSATPVNYRLIDNQTGVISQGVISVVNGKFSATVSFKSYSTSGRLDVFNTDLNGREINEVQIPVNF